MMVAPFRHGVHLHHHLIGIGISGTVIETYPDIVCQQENIGLFGADDRLRKIEGAAIDEKLRIAKHDIPINFEIGFEQACPVVTARPNYLGEMPRFSSVCSATGDLKIFPGHQLEAAEKDAAEKNKGDNEPGWEGEENQESYGNNDVERELPQIIYRKQEQDRAEDIKNAHKQVPLRCSWSTDNIVGL